MSGRVFLYEQTQMYSEHIYTQSRRAPHKQYV